MKQLHLFKTFNTKGNYLHHGVEHLPGSFARQNLLQMRLMLLGEQEAVVGLLAAMMRGKIRSTSCW